MKKILEAPDLEIIHTITEYNNDIWFFGDSITKGVGCLDPTIGNTKWECEFFEKYPETQGDTFTTILANHFKRNKKNYGSSGASPDFVLNMFTELLPEYKEGDIIVLQIPFITRGFFFDRSEPGTFLHYANISDLPKVSMDKHEILENYIIYIKDEYSDDWFYYWYNLFYDFVKYFLNLGIEMYIWNGESYSAHEKIIDYTMGELQDHHLSWNGHKTLAQEMIDEIESGKYYRETSRLIHNHETKNIAF